MEEYMDNQKNSIVIPVFNKISYLDKALQSVMHEARFGGVLTL